ncbi:MAG TPA: hypothetical protein PKY76_10475 [Bacteroidales bacterium]|nr:hypothetical protein [Bacteroidales bacterium]
MSKNKRKFGLEEKLQILREGANHGVDVTCRKYQIALAWTTTGRISLAGGVLIVLPCYRFVG